MTLQETMYRRFRKAGMTHAGACGTLGQIQHEGVFRSNNAEDGRGIDDDIYTRNVDTGVISAYQFAHDGIGYGYAQWTHPSRKALMYDYFKARGKSIADSDTQIEFLIWEMKHFFPVQWNIVTKSDDLYRCTWELLDKWENPAEKTNNIKKRYASAQDFDKMFSSIIITVGGDDEMTKDEAIKKVLDLARDEIGYHEKASNTNLDDKTANSGSGNWTKYARDLAQISNFYNGNKNGYAWCDVWYDWLFVKSFGAETGRQMLCQPYNSAGAGCLYSVQYYKQSGQWVTGDPQPGDQIFFTYAAGEVSHTGIVEEVQPNAVITIEGNTSEQVARRTYSKSSASIYGYGRPKWEFATGAVTDVVEAPFGHRVLKLGTSGNDVKELQEKLLTLGYDLGPDGADGDFGDKTYEAVRKFQNGNGLYVDGEVGTETLTAIEKAVKEKERKNSEDVIPGRYFNIRTLKQDMEGSDVKLAQAALQCWGYTTVITGIFGKEMEQKVSDFQKKQDIEVTGEIDAKTWRYLLMV